MRLNIIIVKIASRCNLNCSYCYMYNLGDSTYKDQPKVMSSDVTEAVFYRIKEHCLEHDLKEFGIVLHGGEPLLAGLDYIKNFVASGNRILKNEINLHFNLQTNGILLTDHIIEELSKLKVGIGISLDGPKEVNDNYRLYHNGKGSYDDTVKGLNKLLAHDYYKPKTGILSVIDIDADPIAIYNHLNGLGVNGCDFLFPYGTYDNPPKGKDRHSENTLYADWLIKIFDEYFTSKKPTLNIRLFSDIIASMWGQDIMADYLGNKKNEVMVVETDGTMEAVDGLKSCGEGFTKTDSNVKTNTFAEALNTPLAKLYHHSHSYLSEKCLACPIVEVCGGGDLANRYSKVWGFDAPSIYCKDLEKLIVHIQNRLFDNFPRPLIEETKLEKLNIGYIQEIRTKKMSEAESDYKTILTNFRGK